MATITTPTPATDSASAGGGDFDLGSVLSEAYDSAVEQVGDSDQGAAGDAAPPEVESADIELGSLDEPEPAKPAEAAKPEAKSEPTAPGEYKLSPDGKTYLVPKSELPALQSAKQFQQAVGKFFADPQQAETAYLQASDLRAMGNDWLNGSDPAIEGVLNHWAGMNHQDPQMRQRFQQSFVKMSEKLPDMLKQINPQAYDGMVQGMLSRAIDNAYAKAQTTQNPEDFKRAQELDWGVTGTYKTELPKVDPQAARLTQLEQERKAFDQRQEVALGRDTKAFNNEVVEGAKYQQLNTMIDKILGPAKSRYSEVAYADLKEGIKRELVDTLRNQPEFWREHEQTWTQLMDDFRAAWRAGQNPNVLEPRIKAYISNFISVAKRQLPAIAQKRVNATTAKPAAATTPRTPTGQFAPQSTAPSTPQNGSPTPNGRMSSEQWDKEWNSVFAPFRQ